MSGFSQNLTPVREPSLMDLLNLYRKQTLLDLNCHHIGTIQSFDAATQTAKVTVNYKKTFFNFDATTNVYTSKLTDYPIMADVPVVTLHGGPAYLNLPVSAGDQCLLFFNDRDIDNWYSGSTTSATKTPRLHSFADAFALVGPNNLNTVISGYDAVRAILTNGTVKNGINPSNNKLVLTNGTSLNTLLQNLCTQLQNLTTALAALTVTGVTTGPGVSGVPSNAAAITNIGTQIGTIATNIGSLIE